MIVIDDSGSKITDADWKWALFSAGPLCVNGDY